MVFRVVLLMALLAFALWLLARFADLPPIPYFLVWHNALEISAVVISALVFAAGWHSHSLNPDRRVLVVACGFLGVGLLDFAHAMSYPGMPDYFTPNSLEKTINFWLVARYLAALTLLAVVVMEEAPTESGRSLSPLGPLLAAVAIVVVCHWLFLAFPHRMPATFVPGEGLTRFKIGAEWGVIIVHVITAGLLARRLDTDGVFSAPMLLGALCLMAISGLFFTLYVHHTDHFNFWGHIYKVLAYGMLYRAVFVETIIAPYRELRRSEQHLQAVFNAIPDLVFELDGKGRILVSHARNSKSLVRSPERMIGREVGELLPEAAAGVVMSTLAKASEQGSAHSQPYALELPDGHRWFELSAARMDGSPEPRFVVLVRDISDRVEDQDTLRKLMQAVEQSPTVIVITDLEGRIEFANPAFVASTGYTLAEAMGQNPRFLQSGQTPPETYEELWQTLQDGQSWSGEFINRRKNGEDYIESVLIFPIRDDAGATTHYMAIKQDITRLKAGERRIEQLTNFDSLTGLPSRKYLAESVEQALALMDRSGSTLALIYLDLDQFKHINETLGHQVGDALLQVTADRLQALVASDVTVSRQGGDEFILVAPFCTAGEAVHLAEDILACLGRPCEIRGQSLVVTASIGIAMYPADGHDFEALAQGADAAMYQAKQQGRNTYRFFSSEMQARAARNLRLETALRFALAERQLELHYQPKVSIADGAIVGVEALLRWRHPELGMISPMEFIPIAESSGQILAIGEWVLRQAVVQAGRWRDAGHGNLTMAVNLSLVQFRDAGLPGLVAELLAGSGLPPHCLELELTESVAMSDPEWMLGQLGVLDELGVFLAIDDFGTGYSSLSYIKQLRVDTLKIDQSFVAALDDSDRSIVRAVVSMAESLGMATLAEGVETLAQRDALRDIGCQLAQGYLYSPPLPVEQLEPLLALGRIEV